MTQNSSTDARSHAEQRGDRAHRLGLVVNLCLALGKILVGLLTSSPALLADGFHSTADVATNAVAWLSFRVSRRPADSDHHYGHGKAEAVAGLFVALVLLGGGVQLVREAFDTQAPSYLNWQMSAALVTALISIGANEWLAAVTRRSAEELNSHALRALARDNRADSLTSLLVVIGIIVGRQGVPQAEAWVTGLMGLSIAHMGLSSLRESLDVLMDRVADTKIRARIEDLARSVDAVSAVQRVQLHPLGAHYRVDMEISVDGQLSVSKGHAIAHEVERVVTQAENGVVQVAVHVNPSQLEQPGG
jgi:cation diffusion facilitator family transporter